MADDNPTAEETEQLEPLVIPDDLTGLSEDELNAAIEECQERSELLNTNKTIESLPAERAVELIENAVATGEALDAEQAKRDEQKAEAERVLAETRERLAKRLNKDEDAEDADDEADDDEEPTAEDTDDEPEADADEAEPEVPVRTRQPVAATVRRRRREHEPSQANPAGPKLYALKDLPGAFAAGKNITLDEAAALVGETWNRSHRVDGPRLDLPLMRFAIDTPPERTLGEDDGENWDKIYGATAALVAAGGLCAPPEPFYDFQLLSGAQTPVVDSITRFNAARGGIRWMTPPTLAAITTGVGTVTNANDALGGTNAAKTCQTIACPEQQTAFIDAVYHCLTMGNMGARALPELVKHMTSLTMAAHARVRETKALDALKAGSTQVTQATVGGAAPTLLGGILQAVEGMRSRHRMPDNAALRAWLPAWSLGLLAEDFIRRPYDRMEALDNGYKAFVTAKMRAAGIAPTFYVDTETSGGMVFAAQGAGALLAFPATVKWFLAPEGTWIRLDGGTLDLGIVRDSVLNAQNDFQMFGEVFETYAKVGIESLEITTTTAASGVVTAPA